MSRLLVAMDKSELIAIIRKIEEIAHEGLHRNDMFLITKPRNIACHNILMAIDNAQEYGVLSTDILQPIDTGGTNGPL